MREDLSKSQILLIRLGRLCLAVFLAIVIPVKVCGSQDADPGIWRVITSSGFYLVQADEEESTEQEATETEAQDKPVQEREWEPSAPMPQKYDWIQLKSGEWLKGKLEVMYDRKLEFDSEELDYQEFDFEDVKQIRGHSIFSVRLEGPEGPVTVIGYLEVTETKVYITLGEDRAEFSRDQLIAIAHGAPKEINYWSMKLDLGVNFTSGNTDQTQYSAIGKVMRRTSGSRIVLDYLGNFTRTENIETVNNHRLSGFWDIFRTRKYFLRPVFAEYYRDPITNIQRRITVGTGIGYHIIDTKRTKWEATAGPAYQETVFISVEEGQAPKESTPSFTFSTAFETEITKRIDLKADYNLQIVNEASGSVIHHFITTLETELTRWLDFDISFV